MGATIFDDDLLTGCYFCFVSLSSIGFGDVISERVYSFEKVRFVKRIK